MYCDFKWERLYPLTNGPYFYIICERNTVISISFFIEKKMKSFWILLACLMRDGSCMEVLMVIG